MNVVLLRRPVVNIDELDFEEWGHGTRFPGAVDPHEKYQARKSEIGQKLGARKLDYRLMVLAPGKCALPFHSHMFNEEMFFIVAGTGVLRLGDAQYPLRSGDVIACLPGGPEVAHQIINTSASEELRYLAVSTTHWPEVTHYPDSGKFGVKAEYPGPDGKPQQLRFIGRAAASLDFWDGE